MANKIKLYLFLFLAFVLSSMLADKTYAFAAPTCQKGTVTGTVYDTSWNRIPAYINYGINGISTDMYGGFKITLCKGTYYLSASKYLYYNSATQTITVNANSNTNTYFMLTKKPTPTYAPPTATPAPKTAVIKVRITNSSGSPLASGKAWADLNLGQLARKNTDSFGDVYFTVYSGKSYTIRAGGDGFNTTLEADHYVGANGIQITKSLTPKTPSKSPTKPPSPTISQSTQQVTICVYDSSSTRTKEGSITIRGQMQIVGMYGKYNLDDGCFKKSFNRNDVLEITTNVPGFISQTKKITVTSGMLPINFYLKPYPTSDPCAANSTVCLTPTGGEEKTYSISGKVFNDQAKNGVFDSFLDHPINGIELRLNNTLYKTVKTNNSGDFVFSNIKNGTYTIEIVNLYGYDPELKIRKITVSNNNHSINYPLKALEISKKPEKGTMWIEGRVSSENNSVEGATIFIKSAFQSTANKFDASTKTTSGGSFKFDGLSEGRYTLTISVPDGYSLSGPSIIETNIGFSKPNQFISWQLKKSSAKPTPSKEPGRIKVKVLDENEKPMPNGKARVEVYNENNILLSSIGTDSLGISNLSVAPDKQHKIIALSDGYFPSISTNHIVGSQSILEITKKLSKASPSEKPQISGFSWQGYVYIDQNGNNTPEDPERLKNAFISLDANSAAKVKSNGDNPYLYAAAPFAANKTHIISAKVIMQNKKVYTGSISIYSQNSNRIAKSIKLTEASPIQKITPTLPVSVPTTNPLPPETPYSIYGQIYIQKNGATQKYTGQDIEVRAYNTSRQSKKAVFNSDGSFSIQGLRRNKYNVQLTLPENKTSVSESSTEVYFEDGKNINTVAFVIEENENTTIEDEFNSPTEPIQIIPIGSEDTQDIEDGYEDDTEPTISQKAAGSDLNNDGVTNLMDYNIFECNFIYTDNCRNESPFSADMNKDGNIDLLDFAYWRNRISNSRP